MGKFFVGKVITSTLVVLGIFAFLSIPHALAAASFYVSPSSGTYAVGTTVSANVMIDSGGDAINAGEGEVFFSSDILEYQSISTSGSIFTFWTSGPSGSSTKVSFGGGLSNPGYSGGAGKVVTITWKAKKEGIGAVTINGNKILANDGVGTNLYNTSSSAHFTISSTGTTEKPGIASPIVQSSTHPNQSTWYNSRSVSLSWSSSGAKEYAYSYDRTSLTDPSGADSPTTNRTYDVASDGIWYFHVKAKTDAGYSSVTHFTIRIDTVAPDQFAVSVDSSNSSNPSPRATFETKDQTSGVDRYEGRIDGGDWFAIKSGDKLPKQKPGSHTIIVRAIDRAGNTTESSAHYTVVGIDPPKILQWTRHILLLDPAEFVGRSDPNDTIHVYLNGKEIDSFIVKDKKVSDSDVAFLQYNSERANGEMIWRYRYTAVLYPGKQSFQFSRTNALGAESGLTDVFETTVNASVVKIGNHIIPTIDIMLLLLIVILILSVLVVLFWVRLRSLAAVGATPFVALLNKSRHYFESLDKKIDRDIDRDIPDSELSKVEVERAKVKLEKDVHELIEHEKASIEHMNKKE